MPCDDDDAASHSIRLSPAANVTVVNDERERTTIPPTYMGTCFQSSLAQKRAILFLASQDSVRIERSDWQVEKTRILAKSGNETG